MTTPPRIARAEVDAALARIADRRRGIDDELFGEIDVEKPADVLEYLRTKGREVCRERPDVVRADVRDGLVLHVWQWWEERRRELDLLKTGLRFGLSRTQVGSALGLGAGVRTPEGNPRQGVGDRIDRLEALLRFDRPDAALTREARRLERQEAADADPQGVWLAEHRDWISTVAARLLSCEALADDEAAEYLVEVRRDWREDMWTPASLVWMGLAAAALQVAPAVLKLGPGYAVHRAIKDVHELRTALAGLERARTARKATGPAGGGRGRARR